MGAVAAPQATKKLLLPNLPLYFRRASLLGESRWNEPNECGHSGRQQSTLGNGSSASCNANDVRSSEGGTFPTSTLIIQPPQSLPPAFCVRSSSFLLRASLRIALLLSGLLPLRVADRLDGHEEQ